MANNNSLGSVAGIAGFFLFMGLIAMAESKEREKKKNKEPGTRDLLPEEYEIMEPLKLDMPKT